MKIRIRIGAILLGVTFLTTFFAILFGCYPIEKHWQINPDPGSMFLRFHEPLKALRLTHEDRCQPAVSRLQVAVLITLNISTDFYLMSIPLPVNIFLHHAGCFALIAFQMIWKSRLAAKKKWALSVMFSGGLLIMVFGLLRCILILKVSRYYSIWHLIITLFTSMSKWSTNIILTNYKSGANGAEQAGEWSIRESFVAVMVNNLPMLYSLYQYLTRPRDPASNSPSYKLGSYRSGESNKKHSKRFRHPLSVPNDTANGSDERIVVPPGSTEAYFMPAPRGENRYGGAADEEKGIKVQTELSVQSTQGGEGEGRAEQEPVGHRFPLQRPPPGFQRTYA